jgi:hypothetical protein
MTPVTGVTQQLLGKPLPVSLQTSRSYHLFTKRKTSLETMPMTNGQLPDFILPQKVNKSLLLPLVSEQPGHLWSVPAPFGLSQPAQFDIPKKNPGSQDVAWSHFYCLHAMRSCCLVSE